MKANAQNIKHQRVINTHFELLIPTFLENDALIR